MHDDIDPSRRFTLTIERSIKNPKGCAPLNEVWALFPHSCLVGKEYLIKAVEVRPAEGDDPHRRYDWPFAGTRWKERTGEETAIKGGPTESQDILIREVAVESQDIFGKETEEVEGRSIKLNAKIDFPDILSIVKQNDGLPENPGEDPTEILTKCKDKLASSSIQKTLVRIPFRETPLDECEMGWLRLVVEPVSMHLMPVKVRKLPGTEKYAKAEDDYALSYEQRLEVVCPLVLRDMLYESLDGDDIATTTMRHFVESLMLTSGTSTRIGDHRIALIVPREGMDIYDNLSTSRGVLYYGMFELGETHAGFLWGCGSNRNLDDDLVHNVMRVVHRLTLDPGIPPSDLANQLAPSRKYEAFSLLLNLMQAQDIGIIRKTAGGTLELARRTRPLDSRLPLPSEDDLDLNQLRSVYARRAVREEDKRLVTQFGDLHPFRIFFRLVWSRLGHGCMELIDSLMRTAGKPASHGRKPRSGKG